MVKGIFGKEIPDNIFIRGVVGCFVCISLGAYIYHNPFPSIEIKYSARGKIGEETIVYTEKRLKHPLTRKEEEKYKLEITKGCKTTTIEGLFDKKYCGGIGIDYVIFEDCKGNRTSMYTTDAPLHYVEDNEIKTFNLAKIYLAKILFYQSKLKAANP